MDNNKSIVLKFKEISDQVINEISVEKLNPRSEIFEFAYIRYKKILEAENVKTDNIENFEKRNRKLATRWMVAYSFIYLLIIKESYESYSRPETNVSLLLTLVAIYSLFFILLVWNFYFRSPYTLIRKFIIRENEKIIKSLKEQKK